MTHETYQNRTICIDQLQCSKEFDLHYHFMSRSRVYANEIYITTMVKSLSHFIDQNK